MQTKVYEVPVILYIVTETSKAAQQTVEGFLQGARVGIATSIRFECAVGITRESSFKTLDEARSLRGTGSIV